MNNLKNRRLSLGLTQGQIVDRLKSVDPRMDIFMVSRFENGICLPTPEVLNVLSVTLQMPVNELYGAEELAVIETIEPPDGAAMSPMTSTLASTLGFGRRNAISREALAEKLGMSDRNMRKAIEQARREGLVILCECNGRGYYLSTNLDEIQHQYYQDRSRALAILARCKTMRRQLKAAGRHV